MTIAWLKKVLDKVGNDDAPIFISVNGKLYPLCGRVDKLIITFEKMDEPGFTHGEDGICFYPCKCKSEKQDEEIAHRVINEN